jgi:nucleoside-diphosphate-sugar epimerase
VPGVREPPSAVTSVVALRYFTVYGPRQRPDMADGNIAHHMIIRRADVTVSQLAAVLGQLLQPDGSKVDDQDQ